MLTYNIKQFIKYGVHIGHYKWESDYRLSYFLLGIRNFIHIINIYYTLYALKKALNIIYNNIFLNQRLLVVNNTGYNLDFNYKKVRKTKLWFINKKWTGGLLTNQRNIYLYNKQLFLKFYNLGYFSLLPSYVFVSNIEKTSSSIFEAIILNIPNSSILDSNQGFYGIFYAFNGNDDSLGTIKLFNRILIKTVLKSYYEQKNFFKKKKKKKLKWLNRLKLFKRYNRYMPYNIKYKRYIIYKRNNNWKWKNFNRKNWFWYSKKSNFVFNYKKFIKNKIKFDNIKKQKEKQYNNNNQYKKNHTIINKNNIKIKKNKIKKIFNKIKK